LLEGDSSYHQRLVEIVNETLTFDLATIYKVPLANISSLNRLLEVICRSKPIDEKYFIEVGGIEVGYKNRIPLWLFGFLY
jgi:hypothetical protein